MPATPPDLNADPEAAFARHEDALRALPDGALEPFNVDLDAVSRLARSLAVRCTGDDLWPRLDKLHDDLFEAPVEVERLAGLAAAGSWLVTRGLSVRAAASEAQLPAALVDESMAVRKRMLQTAAYCLDDRPAVVAELADIHSGRGYDDVKHDLRRLALLYRDHADGLSGKKYQAGDAARALELADQIQRRQRNDDGAADQRDLEQRVWTLLKRHGERVREAAWFVSWDLVGVRNALPSVHDWRRRRSAPAPTEPVVPADSPVES